MADGGGTCEYVFDPDDPETWGGEDGESAHVERHILDEDGVWPCPHDAEDGANLCIFHRPVDEKAEDEVIDQFFGAVDASNDRRPQFIGGRFGAFEIEAGVISTGAGEEPIRLSHATFTSITLDGVEIESDVYLRRVDTRNTSSFRTAHFGGVVDLTRAELWGGADFCGARFDDRAVFHRTAFGGRADFSASAFVEATFTRAAFGDACLFEGAEFGRDVDFNRLTVHGRSVFESGQFRGNADFRRSDFEGRADFSLCAFDGDTDFELVRFRGEATFSEGQFGGASSFDSVTFERDAIFRDSTFRSRVTFGAGVFEGYVDFSRVAFEQAATFRDIRCTANAEGRLDAVFRSTDFDGRVQFGNAVFRGTTSFESAGFDDVAHFRGAEFGDEVDFLLARFHSPNFSTATFDGDAGFTETTFVGVASFAGAEFETRAEFKNAEFTAGPHFAGVDLTGSVFARADVTDATFSGADLRRVDFESALLSRATLFGADLRGAKLSGAVIGDIRVDDETRFLGHPTDDSDASPHTFSAIRSRPTCVYDPDYEADNGDADVDKAKSVYRALEELGGKHARPRLQARSFVRRQDLQKNEYKRDTKQADSWEQRLIAGARYSRAKVARATLLYGESPWRAIAYSLGIILGFALLFPLGGWMKPDGGDPLTYAQIAADPVELLNAVYYSTLTFTALGFGDFEPVGFGRALTTIETGLGAVLLALLVFILGRRAAR